MPTIDIPRFQINKVEIHKIPIWTIMKTKKFSKISFSIISLKGFQNNFMNNI